MSNGSLKISEIFFSIQGESSKAGLPTVFVRTSGCPLRCTYCDTEYAFTDGKKMSVDEVVLEVSKYPTPHVCLTGGEPLVQKSLNELIVRLCDMGKQVSIETGGFRSIADVDPRVKRVLDVKTPGSGEGDTFLLSNLDFLTPADELKFVITSKDDFEWSTKFLLENRIFEKVTVLFSPSHGQVDLAWLADEILKTGLPIRLQTQLHKVIWPDKSRGY